MMAKHSSDIAKENLLNRYHFTLFCWKYEVVNPTVNY